MLFSMFYFMECIYLHSKILFTFRKLRFASFVSPSTLENVYYTVYHFMFIVVYVSKLSLLREDTLVY